MRPAFAASALCFIFLVYATQPATSQATAPASPATPSASATTPTAAPGGDAAAKHAKRTACLQETKARKLVGADKTAYLKSCIEAPPAISASQVSASH